MTLERDPKLVSRRRFLSATAAGFGTLALVACGASTTAPPTEGGASAAGEASAAAEGEASVAAEASMAPTLTPLVLGTGGQKVQFWHGLGGADGATMVQMLQQYSADHPDISLSSETYDWDVFYQKLPTATAAGTPPNLGIMHSWGIEQFAVQGIIQDADTVFFSEGLVPKDDFNPAMIEAISVDGKTQAVPFDSHGWINWVNTKVIEDAGLDPEALPANGTEFIEWAKKITVDEAGKHPDEDGFNADAIKGLRHAQLVAALHTAVHDLAVRRRHLLRGRQNIAVERPQDDRGRAVLERPDLHPPCGAAGDAGPDLAPGSVQEQLDRPDVGRHLVVQLLQGQSGLRRGDEADEHQLAGAGRHQCRALRLAHDGDPDRRGG